VLDKVTQPGDDLRRNGVKGLLAPEASHEVDVRKDGGT
jgi:hypothetical protein